jgi:hypothetical protein
MSTLNQVVHQLQAHRQRAAQEIEKLDLAIKALASAGGSLPLRRKPKFTAAARGRIAAAQRARWAKIKAAQKK